MPQCTNSWKKTKEWANGTVRYRISPTRMESTMAKVGRIDASFNPDTMHVCSEHFEPNLLEPWGM